MEFKNLDAETRKNMLLEIEADEQLRRIYISPRLNGRGVSLYTAALKDAVSFGDAESLSNSLRMGCFQSHYQRHNPKGGFISVTMPYDAPQTLAEGEFNRYYIRGVCLRAIQQGEKMVRIYRAKVVRNPRFESQQKIGLLVSAERLLNDLRQNIGVDTALGLPSGPNSGLSAELVA